MSTTRIQPPTAYRCPSCDAALEADAEDWADWRVCPKCDTPCRLPEPTPPPVRVTAGSFQLPPTAPRGTSPGRMSWLDSVVPPPQRTSTAPPPQEGTLVAEEMLIVFEETVQTAPTVPEQPRPSPPTEPPRPTARSSSRPNPTPEELAAMFARPARMPQAAGARRPRRTRNKHARAFLGLCLCGSTIALLFQLMDRRAEFAGVWALAAIISLILLIRPPSRF